MGGAVSAGENNDELIDNLVQANYIRSKEVEEIFRAVDRREYYLDGNRDTAYRDLAWRHEHLHISAPCIYSEVMSSLQLKEGLSFLNIGSGTGYLSTMVGLALGTNGINHGIEIHSDVVDYARKNIEKFVNFSHAFDKYNFCEPEFVVGNCLNISLEEPGYDRIYCGAACPSNYVGFIKSLLNVNGILIMPLNNQLNVITRTSQSSWEYKGILDVDFASIIVPNETEPNNNIYLPKRNPVSLKSLCRGCIRSVLSKQYNNTSNRRHQKKKKTQLDFSSSSESSSSDDNGEEQSSETPQIEKKSTPPKAHSYSSILNVSSGTVTMVTENQDTPPLLPPRNLSQNNQENTRNPETGTSASSGNGRMQSSSLRRFLSNKKSKLGHSKEEGGNIKRVKHGCMPFLRRRKKILKPSKNKEKQEEKEESEEEEEKREMIDETVEVTESAPESLPSWSMLESDQSLRTMAYSDRQGRRENGIDLFFSSDVRTLRSFLVGMTNRFSETVVPVGHAHSPTLSRSRVREREEGDSHVVKKYERVEETPNEFRNAVSKLPVPSQIKDFLLFYRKQ